MKKLFILLMLVLAVNSVQAQRRSGISDADKRNTGIGITIGGVALTAAALLEGGSTYGTYGSSKNVYPNSATSTYIAKPFWKQAPRNIMFVAGLTLTISGLFTIAASNH